MANKIEFTKPFECAIHTDDGHVVRLSDNDMWEIFNQYRKDLYAQDVDAKMEDFVDIYGDKIKDYFDDIVEKYVEIRVEKENDEDLWNAADYAWQEERILRKMR